MRQLFAFLRYVIDRRKALGAVLAVELVALSLLVGCRGQAAADAAKYEAQIQAMEEAHAAELAELTAQAEAGVYVSHLADREQGHDTWYPVAVWLGDLQELYPGITADSRSMACWGVFRRMESVQFPDTALEVLQQSGQFDEFDPEGIPTEENITIAKNQWARWMSGDIAPCGAGAVYISISSEGCVLRDSFEGGKGTNYWRAG